MKENYKYQFIYSLEFLLEIYSTIVKLFTDLRKTFELK